MFTFRKRGRAFRTSDTVAALELPFLGPLLFINPHDDDAALSSGLLIQAAVSGGVGVSVLVVTDGRMGYRTVNERAGIVLARRAECLRSFGILGVPPEAVTFLGYPDADLERHVGRRAATGDHPEIIGGFEGLRNSLVAHIRRVRPAAVFLASSSDLHPDHQVVAREGLISTFHAAVEMWPELGEPMPVRPVCWEYLVGYGEPPDPPSLQLQAGIPVLQRKLEAVRAYESQGDIGGLLHGVAREGPYEYFWARNPPLVDKTKYGRYFMRW